MTFDLGSIDSKRAAELGLRADMDLEPCERPDFEPVTRPKPVSKREHLWKQQEIVNG